MVEVNRSPATTVDAIAVGELLQSRFGLPFWQIAVFDEAVAALFSEAGS